MPMRREPHEGQETPQRAEATQEGGVVELPTMRHPIHLVVGIAQGLPLDDAGAWLREHVSAIV
jgi:hypothetical protein